MKRPIIIVLLALSLCAHSQDPAPYNVVIDEIMADPTPVRGLPNAEFIELKNVSSQTFNIKGWRVGDAGSFATIAIDFLLQPDSFVVICASSSVSLLNAFGPTIGVSNFPSLDNDGDQLYLRSKEGRTLHAVEYSAAWYQDPIKNQGGWSLEMIDTGNPCSGFGNWMASLSASGGTPGKKNSADAMNKDLQPPVLQSAFAPDSNTIIIRFDEPLDSVKAAAAVNYSISDGIGSPLLAIPLAPVFNQLKLKSAQALQKNKVYTITATNVTDCAGNAIGAYHTVKLGLAAPADSSDLVINEILFNPLPDGADYAELYNRSSRIIDLKDCYIANRANDRIASVKQISAVSRLLFPGEYLVVTDNVTAVERQYLAKDPAAFAAIAALPSFPDDEGDIVIVQANGRVLDELHYDEHWQFKLLDNKEGVALERIDYNKPTQDASNWHSASTSVGYGTPGYQNSQFSTPSQLQGSITVIPSVFSPDNDGVDDMLSIYYQFPDSGYTCNITVFDANGRPVRYLTRNALCGIQGVFRWNGLNENADALPIGVYIIFTEVFNLGGKTNRFKQAVTLAQKLR
ncbi:MAG: lamin tail domain-containing protein [Bacteroidota bacterium]